MFQKTELEAMIREMFSDAYERGYTEEETEELLDGVDFSALTQAIRHDAEIVYAFRTDTKCEIGGDYRGQALFEQRATLLYEDVHEVLYDAAIIGRSAEMWLLENMTVAVVSCVTIMVGNEDVIAQYRVFKSWDWEDCGIEDLEDFAEDLKAMCATHKGRPYYEL